MLVRVQDGKGKKDVRIRQVSVDLEAEEPTDKSSSLRRATRPLSQVANAAGGARAEDIAC